MCVTLAADELPPNADRSVESYYVRRLSRRYWGLASSRCVRLQIQAPRISYLPLLLPQIRKHLLDLMLDGSTSASIPTDDLWFSYDGTPLRW